MPAFKLPTLRNLTAIVNGRGQPTDFFLRLWNLDLVPRIERAVTDLQDVQAMLAQQQADLAAQQALIVEALELANIAIGLTGGTSGTTVITMDIIGDTWQTGPQVDLTGVVAGDVSIPGSGLYATSSTTQNIPSVTGEARLVEVVGGVDTVIGGPWPFESSLLISSLYVTNSSLINTFTDARTTTGAVSYRMDFRMDEPSFELLDVDARLFARRTS